jgi:hypothetical protein
VDFQDQKAAPAPKAERNPNNYNILKGGQVDPGSKLYQRSVAGRQKLEDYVKDLWDQGKDEKDVFMSAVKSLMGRGHGYVGAYLDSKDPGRRYTEPQAMKIADEVMSKAGIGSNPGARLTPAKDDDEREARKGDRAQRREARKSGPEPAPAQKAKPVGQQRKEGKRTGTDPVAEDDTRRAGIGEPATGPVSGWQKTLEDRMEGKATTSDVLAAFQKQYQSRIRGGAAKPAEEGDKTSRAKPPTEAAKPTPTTEESKAPAPAEEPGSPEETDRVAAPPDMVANTFRKKFNDAKKQLFQQEVALARKERRVANPKVAVPSQDDIDYMVEETVEDLADRFDIDYDAASDIISKQFRIEISRKDSGGGETELPEPKSVAEPETDQTAAPPQEEKSLQGPSVVPEQPQQDQSAGSSKERQNSKPGQFKGKVASDISPKDIGSEEERLLRRYVIAMGKLRDRGLTGMEKDIYGDGLEWATSRGLPSYPQEEQRILDSRKKESKPNLETAKEAVRDAATEPLPDFRNAVMRQLKLPLGSRDAKTRIADGAAGRREQKLETQRTRTGQEMAKAARARQRTAPKTTQPELFTPSGKPKQFKTEPASNPIANAVAEVGKILRSPDVKQTSLDSFARMVLNGIERHKRATGGKGFGR